MVDEILTKISETLSGWGDLIIFLIVFYVLIVLGKDWWLLRIRKRFIDNIKCTILEIKIPKENLKSPKAMEQVFAALYSTFTFGIKWIDKWWGGRVEEWMSFEMAGFAHSMHFYAYIPEKYRNLVESAFFSQYPNVEIHAVEDYTRRFGDDLPNETYDIFGTDFVLVRENYFPIKTYPFFEEGIEERRLDPIATISEVMSGLKFDEMVWLQILTRPTNDAWKNEAEDLVNEITGRAKKASPAGFKDVIAEFLSNLIWAPVQYPAWGKGDPGEEKPVGTKILTPGEQEILKAVENKISKPGFETVIRFVYLDKKDLFTASNVAAVMGAIHQFTTQHVNSFRPNMGTFTTPRAVGILFREKRLLKRKKKLFQSYLKREMPLQPKRPFSLYFKEFILCIEELATLYHPPITAVGAPSLEPLGAKKGSAPSNLPVVSD